MKTNVKKLLALQSLACEVAESRDLDSAMNVVLQKICKTTGWVFGEAWVPDAAKSKLLLSYSWYSSDFKHFRKISEKFSFKPGVGLPGRVWASKQPEWLPDVSAVSEALFLRQPAAKETGLKAGLGIPVLTNGDVIAVMVFFMAKKVPEDKQLVETISVIGRQLGLIFAHRLHEEALEQSITRLRKAQRAIRYMAFKDPLTKLPNRPFFINQLAHALASAEREKKMIALFYIDLDRFKNINDTLGHRFGDLLLKSAAHRLKENLRKSDLLARIGGDEFAIIASIKKIKDSDMVSQKLLKAFSKAFLLDGREVFSSISIGISVYPSDGKSTSVLLSNADTAMYRAKEAGGNNFRLFSEPAKFHTYEKDKAA